MRSLRIAGLAACLLPALLLLPGMQAQKAPAAAKRPIDYANGLVGTAPLDNQKLIGNAPPPGELLYSGMTSAGATLPHSSTILAPINHNTDLAYPAGVATPYYYPERTMIGFSTGTMGGPTIMPVAGDWTVPPERSGSVYDKAREKSSPGYYSVYLDDYKTRVEMTATTWTGIFRITFPRSEQAHVLLDLGRIGGDVEIAGNNTVRGQAQRGRGARRPGMFGPMYFVAEFSKPFASFGTFKQIPPTQTRFEPAMGDKDVEPDARTVSGHYSGAYLQFATSEGEQVLVKIATGESYEMAEARLKAEQPGWDFDGVHAAAEAAWAKKLDQIEVQGGTEKEKMLFYSCLYHSFASPRLVAQKGEQFTGLDGVKRTATYDRYGPVPYWDTGRDQVVLLTLLEPKVKEDILRSEFDMARESGYMGTSFHGDHAVMMYLGDWERGLNFDWSAVYEYLRKNAMDPDGPRPYLAEYIKNGCDLRLYSRRQPGPSLRRRQSRRSHHAGICVGRSRHGALREKAGQGRRLRDVSEARAQLPERLRSFDRVHARAHRRRQVDLALRSRRALLQLHDEGSVWLVNAVAGSARCAGADQSAGRSREVRRQAGRVLLDALPSQGNLPRLHGADWRICAGQPA